MSFPLLTPDQVQPLLFVFLRVSAMVVTMPIVGNAALPMQVKAGLCLLLTAVIYPQLPLPAAELDFYPFLARMIFEVFVGVIIGFTARFLFAGIQFAGDIMGYQMGFSIADVYDPSTSQQISIIAEFQIMFAMLVFLYVDAHHVLLAVLADSFRTVNVDDFRLLPDFYRLILGLFGQVFVIALKLSAPVAAVLFFVNLGLGVVARTVPQINVFIVGIPVQITVGLVFLGICAPVLLAAVGHLLEGLPAIIGQLLKAI